MEHPSKRKRVYIVRMGEVTWTRISLIKALATLNVIKKLFPESRVTLRSEVRDYYPRA